MKKLILTCSLTILFCTISAMAATPYDITINPANDGRVNSSGGMNTTSWLGVGSSLGQGIVKFSTSQIAEPITQASLSVNPYLLPLNCLVVGVYGYQSSDGQITSSDYNAGSFLGNLILPADLDYGEDAFINITQFMQTVSSPFVSFNLRSTNGGLDGFGSLEENAGHPSQLIVTIPEPASAILIGLGALFVASRRKR